MDESGLSDVELSGEENEENEESYLNLFNDDIDNEETLFQLVSLEHIQQLALDKRFINDHQFDYLHGLVNLIRRLLKIHDEAVDQWLGIDSQEECGMMSIISFIFNIIDDYYERFCLAEIVEFSDMCFSLYDYLCSAMCCLILTLNGDQLNGVEEILFENLFSPNLIRSLLASDIFCFMCRCCKSTFTYDICHVVFSLLNELYVEDVEIKDFNCETAYLNCNLTQEILLNLLNRILAFLDSDEIENFKKDFPLEDYAFLWKRTNIKFNDSTENENDEKLVYDQLYVITKSSNRYLSIVDNFVKANDEYYNLLCLRLLSNMRDKLNCDQVGDILKKTKQILSVENSVFQKKFVFAIFPILNSLSTVDTTVYQNDMFVSILHDILVVLYEASDSNFITKQYFLSTLQNISSNVLFESLVISISIKFKLRKEFKLHLKYYMRGKFMTRDENEIYVSNILKKSYSELSTEDIDYERVFTDVNLLQFNSLNLSKRHSDSTEDYIDCKRIKSVQNEISDDDEIVNNLVETNNTQEESKLVKELQSCINLFRETHSVSKEEKSTLSALSGQLNILIDKLIET